jgi:hypothetical protein
MKNSTLCRHGHAVKHRYDLTLNLYCTIFEGCVEFFLCVCPASYAFLYTSFSFSWNVLQNVIKLKVQDINFSYEVFQE